MRYHLTFDWLSLFVVVIDDDDDDVGDDDNILRLDSDLTQNSPQNVL